MNINIRMTTHYQIDYGLMWPCKVLNTVIDKNEMQILSDSQFHSNSNHNQFDTFIITCRFNSFP